MLGHAGPCCARPGCAVLCWAVLPKATHSVMPCGNLDRPGLDHTKLPTLCPAVPAPGLAMLGCMMPGRLYQPQAILCVPELFAGLCQTRKTVPGLGCAMLCRDVLCHDVADSAVPGCAEPHRLCQPLPTP